MRSSPHVAGRLYTYTDGATRAQPMCNYMYKWNLQNVQKSSQYTDAISHEFHKNGKTYQNTDNMSLSGMKQLLM